ncbi:hypothetical protein HZA39_00145 [Candidatus Peregrinibacteria bacterium]|nr:hypothetical protein [Candidatus Peregrinibacteria bacterium]
MWIKIKKLVSVAAAVAALIITAAGAASIQTANAIGEKDACPLVNYFDDFDVFMSNLISYDSATEFFKDIFSRNQCWRDDIFSIETQLQKQTAAIRKAYENCETLKLPDLKNRAYELQMELMYLRLYAINNPNKAAGQKSVIPRKSAETDLKNLFVKNADQEAVFKSYYDDLKKKYAARIAEYNNCVDPTWKELNEKWDEFVETGAGMSPAWEKMKKKTAEKAKNIGLPKRNWSSLSDWAEVRLNGVAPMQTLSDVYAEFQKNIPKGGGNTYSDLLDAIKSSKDTYAAEVEKVDLKTRYEILYKNESDETSRIFAEKINELNQILRDTFPTQKALFKCAATIQEKQCKNKKL